MATKTIFITGATSGIGKVAALELAKQGNKVFFAARNPELAEQLILEFLQHNNPGSGSLEYIPCDLASFESVRDACSHFLKLHDRLDILINNAGIWNFSFKESKNRIEEIFHVNVLAPALLKTLLLPALKKSDDARIIQTASGLHFGNINFEDIEYRKKFSAFNAYRQSKLGIILLSRLWAKALKDEHIGVFVLHPGVVNTRLARNAGWFLNFSFKLIGISPNKGARTIIHLSTQSKNNLTSGEYYTNKKIEKITKQSYDLEAAAAFEKLVNSYIREFV